MYEIPFFHKLMIMGYLVTSSQEQQVLVKYKHLINGNSNNCSVIFFSGSLAWTKTSCPKSVLTCGTETKQRLGELFEDHGHQSREGHKYNVKSQPSHAVCSFSGRRFRIRNPNKDWKFLSCFRKDSVTVVEWRV